MTATILCPSDPQAHADAGKSMSANKLKTSLKTLAAVLALSSGACRARLPQIDCYLNLVIRHPRGLRSPPAPLSAQLYQPEPFEQCDVGANVLVVAPEQP